MEWSERIGRRGELMFAAEAISRGLTVLQPNGVHGYDWVVEYNGIFKRVQVKTTSVIDQKTRYRWNLKTKDTGSDVHVFHVTDTNLFIMFESSELLSNKRYITIPISRLENYRVNDWEIFKQKNK